MRIFLIITVLFSLFLPTVYTQHKVRSSFIISMETRCTPEQTSTLAKHGIYLDKLIFKNPILYRAFSEHISPEMKRSLYNNKHLGINSISRDREAYYRNTEPNDPFYDNMWHLEKIKANEAWDFATSGVTRVGDTIVLAIFDSGYELDHPDLRDNLWRNKAEIPNDGIDNDGNGYTDDYIGVNIFTGADNHARKSHGTEVMGAMGARGNNNEGIVGVTWNAKVLPISKSVGGVFESDFIEAYQYTIDQRELYNNSDGTQGAFIVAVNLSLGIPRAMASEFPQWCAVYDEMGRHGILGICATDNDNYDVDVLGDMPTTCPSNFIISVTGSDRDDEKMRHVAFGKTNIDLAAPGTDIFCTTLDSDYARRSGTSLAAPLVSGAIGLMYMAANEDLANQAISNPQKTATTIRTLLLENVDILPELEEFVATSGRLNLAAAVRAASNYIEGPAPESLLLSALSPNPVGDNVKLSLSIPTEDVVEILVFDLHMGRTAVNYQERINLPVGEHEYAVNLSDLASGVYVISVEQSGRHTMRRFVKINP